MYVCLGDFLVRLIGVNLLFIVVQTLEDFGLPRLVSAACFYDTCNGQLQQVERMIAEADVSGDGRVDYTEFAHLWKTFLMEKHHKPVAGRLQQVKAPRRLIYLVVGGAAAPLFFCVSSSWSLF